MSYEMTITKVHNGYIIYTPSDVYGEEDSAIVLEEDEYIDDDLQTGQKLLYQVMEYFGLQGSKHDKERLLVEIKEQSND